MPPPKGALLRGQLLSTSLVAKTLGVTRSRVLALIRDGRLKAEKVGREWLIRAQDLEAVKVRKPGRPPWKTPKGAPSPTKGRAQ